MTINNIVSPIPKDKDTQVGSEIELSLDKGLDVIRKAITTVSSDNRTMNGTDPNIGEMQVLFPGPLLRYEGTDQAIVVSVWQHGGNEEIAKRLHHYLNFYSQRYG